MDEIGSPLGKLLKDVVFHFFSAKWIATLRLMY